MFVIGYSCAKNRNMSEQKDLIALPPWVPLGRVLQEFQYPLPCRRHDNWKTRSRLPAYSTGEATDCARDAYTQAPIHLWDILRFLEVYASGAQNTCQVWPLHRLLLQVEGALVKSENREETSAGWLHNQGVPEGNVQQCCHCRSQKRKIRCCIGTYSSGLEPPYKEGKRPSVWAMETLGILLEKFTAFCTCNLRGHPQVWGAVIVKSRNRTSWALWVNVTLWISIGHLPWVGGRGLKFCGLLFPYTNRVLLSTWYFMWFSKRKSGYCIKQDKHFSGKYHWLLRLVWDWGGGV